MITDQQTNTVYFSNTLPEEFPDEFQQLFIRIIGVNLHFVTNIH
jgi:hypothetical protein